jgi:hypothetical protein
VATPRPESGFAGDAPVDAGQPAAINRPVAWHPDPVGREFADIDPIDCLQPV